MNNIQKKRIKTLAMIIVSLVVFLFIFLFVLRIHSLGDIATRLLCSDEIVNEVPNQNNTYKAIVFVRNCGATASFSTQVAITKVKNKRYTTNEIILTSDTNNGKAQSWEWGGPKVEVEWKNNTQLFVLTSPDIKTYTKKTEHKGMNITYYSE